MRFPRFPQDPTVIPANRPARPRAPVPGKAPPPPPGGGKQQNGRKPDGFAALPHHPTTLVSTPLHSHGESTGRNPHDRVLLHTPPVMKSAVPGWCTFRCPSHQAERRAGKGTPTSGQSPGGGRHSPPQAGGREGPRVRGGSPLGRDPRVQRHPDGCVVHAFRCAPRSGAGLKTGVPWRARRLLG